MLEISLSSRPVICKKELLATTKRSDSRLPTALGNPKASSALQAKMIVSYIDGGPQKGRIGGSIYKNASPSDIFSVPI